MNAKPLTDTVISNARASKKPYRWLDRRAAGLYIEIRPTGEKFWRYRYRLGGKENLYAMGKYSRPRSETPAQAADRRSAGFFTLKEAREERDRCYELINRGMHPRQDREQKKLIRQHEAANTFRAIGSEWIDQHAPHWTPGTRRQRTRLLENKIYPELGALPIREVTAPHILALLKKIHAEAPSMAQVARQIISAIYRLAISTARATSNPVPDLKGAIKKPPTKHKTPLSPAEIGEFFRKLDGYAGNFPTVAAIRLLWFTLARTNELLQATWLEFDLDGTGERGMPVWAIPGDRMKRKTIGPHVVPLPPQAVEVLRALRPYSSGAHLFPHRSEPRRHASKGILALAFKALGYSGTFSPHAIRATASTILNEQGYNGDHIERQLAHHHRNESRASYNGAMYLQQRAAMMAAWADLLDALKAGGRVIPLHRTA